MTSSTSPCPCKSGQTYGACCEPFHRGKSKPDSAEKLMRSRYSAYVVGNIDYIGQTNDPETSGDFDAESAKRWSQESQWIGLEIIATREGMPGDQTGEVEFKARYQAHGIEETHHEVSLFRFDAKAKTWLYRDGKTLRTPVQRSEPKVGRNDPCSCGSGKKFKKCCGS